VKYYTPLQIQGNKKCGRGASLGADVEGQSKLNRLVTKMTP